MPRGRSPATAGSPRRSRPVRPARPCGLPRRTRRARPRRPRDARGGVGRRRDVLRHLDPCAVARLPQSSSSGRRATARAAPSRSRCTAPRRGARCPARSASHSTTKAMAATPIRSTVARFVVTASAQRLLARRRARGGTRPPNPPTARRPTRRARRHRRRSMPTRLAHVGRPDRYARTATMTRPMRISVVRPRKSLITASITVRTAPARSASAMPDTTAFDDGVDRQAREQERDDRPDREVDQHPPAASRQPQGERDEGEAHDDEDDDDDVERPDVGLVGQQPVGGHQLDGPEIGRQGDPERGRQTTGQDARRFG